MFVHWDNPEGWDGEGGGRGFWDGWTHLHPWLIHVNVWQKPPPIKIDKYIFLKGAFKKWMSEKHLWATLFIKLFYEFFFYYESNKILLKGNLCTTSIKLLFCSWVFKRKTRWEKFLNHTFKWNSIKIVMFGINIKRNLLKIN